MAYQSQLLLREHVAVWFRYLKKKNGCILSPVFLDGVVFDMQGVVGALALIGKRCLFIGVRFYFVIKFVYCNVFRDPVVDCLRNDDRNRELFFQIRIKTLA